jgi:flagellar biosynthesis protein FliQ
MVLPSLFVAAAIKFFQSVDQITTLVLMPKGIITIADSLAAIVILERSYFVPSF